MRAKRCERQCRAACARLLGDSDHPSLNLDISELIFLLLTHIWGHQSCAWHNCQPGLGAPGPITSAWPWQGSSSTLLVWHRRPHPSSPVSITPQPRPHGAVPFLSDVDECAGRSHGCSQLCVNTAGSFRCACRDGFSLAADHKACQPAGLGPGPGTFSQAGNLLLRQHSPSCSGPLMQAGITSRHHKVAGAGLARERRGDSSQHPSALFPVTQETQKNTLVHKFGPCKGDRARCGMQWLGLWPCSPSSSSFFSQGTSGATRSIGRCW